MVSIIGLDSDKVQQLCDAANEEVDESNKVQIANFLCTVSLFLFYLFIYFGSDIRINVFVYTLI